MEALILAMLGFLAGHFLLSAGPVRRRLVAAVGEKAFLGIYSLLSIGFLAWVISAYRAAPMVPLWDLGRFGRRIPLVVMPGALALAVAGLTSRNPAAVGGERLLDSVQSLNGIFTITRHPFLWGTGLWALAHMAARGDGAALILFGGFAILSFGGMFAIDRKRLATNGAAWRCYTARASLVPFIGALTGRTSVDWRGIGWVRLGLAVALYIGITDAHRWLFGVPAMG
jgi:uncharacterized membrane protein